MDAVGALAAYAMEQAIRPGGCGCGKRLWLYGTV